MSRSPPPFCSFKFWVPSGVIFAIQYILWKKQFQLEATRSWGKVDELDERQKHDMALLGKQTDVLRSTREPKKKRRSQQAQLDPTVQEILDKYCEGSDANLSLQMQQALKELARQLAAAQERADTADEALTSTQSQLDSESEARREVDGERLQALQRVEELELAALEFQAQRRAWEEERRRQPREPRESRECARCRELEGLLKEAILRGAKLSRKTAEAEAAKNDEQRKAASAERQLQRQTRRAQRLAQQRKSLELALRSAERRGDAAEARLGEYLRAAAEGAEKVMEAHIQHLAAAGTSLAAKVDEQAEIIQVLRGLLQDCELALARQCKRC